MRHRPYSSSARDEVHGAVTTATYMGLTKGCKALGLAREAGVGFFFAIPLDIGGSDLII